MGVGVKPQGMGMFGTFLKAQECSQTLVLAHAGIGDHGALEVARFIASNTKLLRLDLTGNGISATGVAHLAGALRQNIALESLVLRHNRLGEGGAVGFQTLCRAVRSNEVLQHLDLRHNNLSGALGAACIGELLVGNAVLTHIELSWNPLDPAGGQVLLDHLKQNTTLFDCQLTGCGIAEETLLEIAQVLRRNRVARGANMQAGPYLLSLEHGGAARGLASSPPGVGRTWHGVYGEDRGADGDPAPGLTSSGHFSGMVVSSSRTEELRNKLTDWRFARIRRGEDAPDVQELLELLNKGQAKLDEEVVGVENLRIHLQCLTRGFQDRVLRYQSDVDIKQALLLDFQREKRELGAIQQRASDELALQREAWEQAHELAVAVRRRSEVEEVASNADLANVLRDKSACEARLRELTAKLEHQEAENKQLREKATRLRQGVVVLQSN